MSRAAKVPCGGTRLVLPPLVDYANHSCHSDRVNVRYHGEADGGVSLVTTRGVQPGEEILVSYGDLSNEQLFFAFGFVTDHNPCGGAPCPLAPPQSIAGSALWSKALAALRGQAVSSGVGAGELPRLSSPDSKVPAAAELLLALRLQSLTEAEAQLLLDSELQGQESSECDRWQCLPETLRPRLQDLLAAVQLLHHWKRELHAAGAVAVLNNTSASSGSLFAARQLQAQTLSAVNIALAGVLAELPLPLRGYWQVCDTVSSFFARGKC